MEVSAYHGREQAFVKHYVLEHYLEQLAYKVAQFRPGTTFNYIDGFSGPWDDVHPGSHDSSPHIAVAKLVEVRTALQKRCAFNVRAMFVEKDPASFQRLKALCAELQDVETVAKQGRFEEMIPDAVHFARTGPSAFTFVFIDPTGWTGYAMHRIAPLLRIKPGEVLINFMTSFVIRFVDYPDPNLMPTFVDLFGHERYRSEWAGLDGLDREDAIVSTYSSRLSAVADFPHVGSTIILDPRKDRTHYHLIYGTRSLRGLVAFRNTEAKALPEQKTVRATARERKRVETTGQASLFTPVEVDSTYLEELMARYRTRAQSEMVSLIREGGVVAYDDVLGRALVHPFTSEKDVKAWLREAAADGEVTLELPAGKRVPSSGRKDLARSVRS